jgi:hypothetical protein
MSWIRCMKKTRTNICCERRCLELNWYMHNRMHTPIVITELSYIQTSEDLHTSNRPAIYTSFGPVNPAPLAPVTWPCGWVFYTDLHHNTHSESHECWLHTEWDVRRSTVASLFGVSMGNCCRITHSRWNEGRPRKTNTFTTMAPCTRSIHLWGTSPPHNDNCPYEG